MRPTTLEERLTRAERRSAVRRIRGVVIPLNREPHEKDLVEALVD